MTDREKIIKGLEACSHILSPCKNYNCPYNKEGCITKLTEDVLRLLTKYKPQKIGYWKNPNYLDCCCSECGEQPEHESGESVPLYDYCPHCGAEMKVKLE